MGVSSSLMMRVVHAYCLCGAIAWSGAHAAVSQQDYDAAILAARSGQTAQALEKLLAWHQAYPRDMRIVYDLATVSDMAGRYSDALRYYPQIAQPEAPAYALKAIAHAARLAERARDAEAAYQLLLARMPDDIDAQVGLAYSWMAQGRIESALDYVSRRLPKSAKDYSRAHVPLLVAQAELHEKREQWLLAAAAYREALRFDPGFRYALRGRAFALARAGLPYLARNLAAVQPDAFSEEEKYRLAHSAAARTIGFGEAQAAVDAGPRRFATIDRGLSENANVLHRFGAMPATQFDRVVVLRDRLRMREAVTLYEALVAAKIDVPRYARFAAADAYLSLRQPESARDIYLNGLNDASVAASAEALDWQTALLYAYNEAEQHEVADALVARMLRESARDKVQPGDEAAAQVKARVETMAALQDMYSDRLAGAEQRLAGMRMLAPFNSDIRSAWAALQSAREHPRAALEEFTLLQIDAPQSLDAAIGRGETLLALNRPAEARAVLRPLQSEQPDNRRVQNFANQFAIRSMPVFQVDTVIGHGATAAGAESIFDGALYSAPLSGSLGEDFRVFTHVLRADGHIGNDFVTRSRLGAGLDYRGRDIGVEAELDHAQGAAGKDGLALALSVDLSDSWRARAALDTNINDLPAAALRDGVTADAVRLGLSWALNESRKAGIELGRMRFSDGNVRDTARAWWGERWISGPIFKLESVVGLAGSANSLRAADYFNPVRDRELSLEVKGEWLTWRRYRRSFKQRLALSVARYWQAGFDAGAAADIHYEHDWSNEDWLGLRYGIGYSFHPYDGSRDSRNYGYLNVYGRIK